MIQLVRFDQISKAYGDKPLLDCVDFHIKLGEHICLVGRNGVGKSTLMGLMEDRVLPDAGTVWKKQDLRMGVLRQTVPLASGQTIYSVVASGLHKVGALLTEWHQRSQAVHNDQDMRQLEKIQEKLEHYDGWQLEQRIDQVLERFHLSGDVIFESLSGGMKRRVDLARAWVNDPELLLLDEPTNHMDIVMIDWLEKQLNNFQGALLFVTHDRAFLRSQARKIMELDRGKLRCWENDYDTYLERKAHAMMVEEKHDAVFDKRLAKEEQWIRQGIKARRTRNEGRVERLKALRDMHAARMKGPGKAKIAVSDVAQLSGKIVAKLEQVCYSFDHTLLIDALNFVLMRGDKVGLIGANGVGKSTLLKIILGQLKPQCGQVTHGTKLQWSYFDQMRNVLALEKTVIDNVSEGRDYVVIDGKERHIVSYLEDFLFAPQCLRSPVKTLSGGEKNRLLLAKLFSKPANLLILDEPTNDLDTETLELLEEKLVNFSGTLLLVSHDRNFLDRVVTNSLIFYGEGKICEYVGGFSDWLMQGGAVDQLITLAPNLLKKGEKAEKKSLPTPIENVDKDATKIGKKLSYKLQLELARLPEEIEALEQKIIELEAKIYEKNFYTQTQEEIQRILSMLSDAKATLENKVERWCELVDH